MKKCLKLAEDEVMKIRKLFLKSIFLIGFTCVIIFLGLLLGAERIMVLPYFCGLIVITVYGFSTLCTAFMLFPMSNKDILNLIKGNLTEIEIEISYCGNCLFYDKKKHRCAKGAINEGEGTDRFYKDCPLDWCNTESTDITPHQ